MTIISCCKPFVNFIFMFPYSSLKIISETCIKHRMVLIGYYIYIETFIGHAFLIQRDPGTGPGTTIPTPVAGSPLFQKIPERVRELLSPHRVARSPLGLFQKIPERVRELLSPHPVAGSPLGYLLSPHLLRGLPVISSDPGTGPGIKPIKKQRRENPYAVTT